MRRPLPNIPRGPRIAGAFACEELILGCPRVAPDWEFAALRALVKPQFKDAILHRSSQQRWPADAEDRVIQVLEVLRLRLGFQPAVHLPKHGDFFLVAKVVASEIELARAAAVLLSRAFPKIWFSVGRFFICDGKFFRSPPGARFQLRAAPHIHLRREIRAALRGTL